MLVTLDVSHFERSPLNEEAEPNAIQKKQKDKKLDRKRKKVRRTILVNNKIHYQYKIEMSETKRKRQRGTYFFPWW